MINIVNKKTYNGSGVYIGRPSPLGNPYTHIADRRTLAQNVVKTRDEAVAKNAGWLDEQMSQNGVVAKTVRNLAVQYKRSGQLTLICWCAPQACHGHILAEKIDEIAGKL